MNFLKGIFVVVLVAIGIFAIGYAELGWDRFFLPRHANVQREVFENTKSYTQGAAQDLARLYEQYNMAKDEKDKEVLANVIKMQFAELDASKLQSPQLRAFLTQIRNY